MKKNETTTSATINQEPATTAPAKRSVLHDILDAKKDAAAPAATKPAATKTGDGKIAVLAIERDSLTYFRDVKAPSMVLKADDFAALLNCTLIARYADEASVKIEKSRKNLEKAEKALKEYAGEAEDEEAELARKVEISKATLEKMEKLGAEIVAARPGIEEEAGKVSDEAIQSYHEIVTLFSLFYSTTAGIDGNKTRFFVIGGMHDLYTACTRYADCYEGSAAIVWDDVRKNAFTEIRNKLTAIGSRLDGAADEYRKGYHFNAGSKDVIRLIAYVTRYSKYARKTGKIGDARNKLTAFQETVLAISFRKKAEDSKELEVEC